MAGEIWESAVLSCESVVRANFLTVVQLTIMRIRSLILLLVVLSTESIAQTSSIDFAITDSTASLNNTIIPSELTIAFFKEKIGMPDRVKKQKDIEISIYDNLGISISSNKLTGKISAISFYYSDILKEYPRSSFSGRIYVNGILLEKDDTPQTILNSLPTFKYENILGLCLYENDRTDFSIYTRPGSDQWTSFGYNFFRQKK